MASVEILMLNIKSGRTLCVRSYEASVLWDAPDEDRILAKNRAEAKSVSIYEYDEEKHMRQVREEGIEQGKQEGLALGKQEGLALGKQEGFALGKQEELQRVLEAGGNRLCRLGEVLINADRKDDLLRAIVNESCREQFYKEFHIDPDQEELRQDGP